MAAQREKSDTQLLWASARVKAEAKATGHGNVERGITTRKMQMGSSHHGLAFFGRVLGRETIVGTW
jgi:hypothetical protein